MGASEREIRSAAEVLLGSSSSLPAQYHGSINSAEYILRDELFTGLRQSGRMSVVRRFFCLFVTFDLLFTFFMWLICIMLAGDDIFKALSTQILHYDVHSSLFDIVMTAVTRFTVLLLFYGLLYIDHWFVIAISTAGTCAFLIAKVFVYNWTQSSQPVFQVLLVLTTFVLSWGEAWFLDFRVIPQESQALRFVQGPGDDERSPLVRNYLSRLPQYVEHTESLGNFYSPLESPQGSDNEDEVVRKTQPHDSTKIVVTRPADVSASIVR